MRTSSGGWGGPERARLDEPDRERGRDVPPVLVVLRGFVRLAARAGEFVRVAMAGERTADVTSAPAVTPVRSR
jgi:hypothetical protein